MDIKNFTNLYQISKTLRFKLIPEGETLNRIRADGILDADRKKSEVYPDVKAILDDYHKAFIEKVLSSKTLSEEEIERLSGLYFNRKEDEEAYEKEKEALCKQISKWFTADEEYKLLKGKELFRETLPQFVHAESDRDKISEFAQFSTYFTNYYDNRDNMYTEKEQPNGIANRIVNDNLPRFFDNCKVGERILATLSQEDIKEINLDFEGLRGISVEEILSLSFAGRVLSQREITAYNDVIGGYSTDNSKVQGLNEKINLYNQTHEEKLPKLKMLYKQILSDRESVSFIPEMFENDQEVLDAVSAYWNGIRNRIPTLSALFTEAKWEKIFIFDKSLTDYSARVYHDYALLQNYADEKAKQSKKQKQENSEKKKNAYYSLKELQDYADSCKLDLQDPITLPDYVCGQIKMLSENVLSAVNGFDEIPEILEKSNKTIAFEKNAIERIKGFMDSLKALQTECRKLYDGKDAVDADAGFYGEFTDFYELIQPISKLYDRVRNYVAKKPYSLKKYKLNFNRSDFLNGWAQPDEYSFSEAHLFEKDGNYYLFISKKGIGEADKKSMHNVLGQNDEIWHLDYIFQKPDNKNTPRLFIRSKGDSFSPAVKQYSLPVTNILEDYDNGWFKTEYQKKDPEQYKKSLAKMIDYFKLGFSRHEAYSCFDFRWKDTAEYRNIADFYKDTINSCYKLEKDKMSRSAVLNLVESGKGYLFRIYSKDFSENSKGLPNLHTIYFKMLFDERNLINPQMRLNGGAELFYRPASLKIEDTTVHRANEPIRNKNELNVKAQSTFTYDLIKNKRFIKESFELHLPITLNAQESAVFSINEKVREDISSSEKQYVIGIDRGERHLLYVSVIDEKGNIVEQQSLNVIGNEYNGNTYRTDYHALLESKEEDRKDARKNWTVVDNIKNLKEGYLSQAVHKICEWVKKYNAVIVMENLNTGFKNVRSGVEKSVYQKFETMLSQKLSYMADKKAEKKKKGGILQAYQLCRPTTSYNDLHGQNGIIFYVPAWMTSKIDPTTGFVNTLYPKYENVEKAKQFIERFTSVSYNAKENWFEFSFDSDGKNWTICTHGTRLETRRDPSANNHFVTQEVDLTQRFKELFEAYGIDRTDRLKEQILDQNEKNFFAGLIYGLKLVLQMRNSRTGSTDSCDDYMISPVLNENGEFFDTRKGKRNLPQDADANGAYNIARKGLMVIEKIRKAEKSLTIKNDEWLAYAQSHTTV